MDHGPADDPRAPAVPLGSETTLKILALGLLTMVLACPRAAAAQNPDELAKQTQNPIASLVSVPFQANCDFGLGDRDATGTAPCQGAEVAGRV